MSNNKAQISKQRGEIAATTHAGWLIPKTGQASRIQAGQDEEAEKSKKKKMLLLAVVGAGLFALAMGWI